jgi:hypothetical protein
MVNDGCDVISLHFSSLLVSERPGLEIVQSDGRDTDRRTRLLGLLKQLITISDGLQARYQKGERDLEKSKRCIRKARFKKLKENPTPCTPNGCR